MRIRTVLALGAGAALGASATYLLDPDHGTERRRDARSRAVARGRAELTSRGSDAVARARTLATESATGFREGLTSG